MTSEVADQGFYVLRDHTLVTLRFENIILRKLKWFNGQNSLAGLGISQVDPAEHDGRRFSVEFDSNYGVSADLLCDRVVVVQAKRFTP